MKSPFHTDKIRRLAVLAFAVIAGPVGAASSLFFTSNAVPVGLNPIYLTTADLNGDGRPELITANENDNTITICTNNGTGQFVAGLTLQTESSLGSVTAADMNNDGKIDLISANGGAFWNDYQGTLTVFTNGGNGTFTDMPPLLVGIYAISVAAADVNGDGWQDLISADNNGNTLTVLTNTGAGQFETASVLPVGNAPFFVIAADVNGDGRPDLISADQDSGQLTVLTNSGASQFVQSATYPVGSGANSLPFAVAAADLNADGSMDLVSANNNNNSLTVLTNKGSGLFSLSATLAVGALPKSVAAADVDGDGRPDLLSADFNDNTLTLFTNSNQGRFGFKSKIGVGNKPSTVVAADLNGDGTMDLASANKSASTLTVLLQLTAPWLEIQPQNNNALALSWSSPFADFIVQTNASLSSPAWAAISAPVVTTGNIFHSVTLTSPPPGKLFFRLIRP